MSSILSDNILYNKRDKLAKKKMETFEIILKRCVQDIRRASDNGDLVCYYKIPPIVFGCVYPMVDIHVCGKYIVDSIMKMNSNIRASVLDMDPNYLFFDWHRTRDTNAEY